MNVRPKIDRDRAAEMWADDKTVGDIAGFFGVTRNAVSGLMNRNRKLFPKKTDGKMDLNPNGQKGGPVKPWGERKPYTRIKPKNINRARQEASTRAEADCTYLSVMEIEPTDAERMNRGKDLMDLQAHECKWPLGSGHPFVFCASATDGRTYCSHHASRAYRPWRAA